MWCGFPPTPTNSKQRGVSGVMRLLKLLVISMALSGCATLDRFDAQDAAWLAMHVIDTGQTVTIARSVGNPSPCRLTEGHPITRRLIGREPDVDHVYKWAVGMVVARWLAYEGLERAGVETRWLKAIDNVIKFDVVYSNQFEENTRAWAYDSDRC